ncbi:MAG: 50S ribosomal protein L29 [Gammaproteobacteria bacterium]|nr:50S ribosomal protein L29 [Gammaproteobacteria bacterium]
MKASDLRAKKANELQTECVALAKQLFVLRMQRNFQSKMKTHLFRQLKKDIARIKTVLTEMEGGSS